MPAPRSSPARNQLRPE